MSDVSQGEGWWIASDDKWYPPEQHPDYVAPTTPPAAVEPPSYAAETVAIPAAAAPPSDPLPIVPDQAAPAGPSFVAPGAATQTYTPGQAGAPAQSIDPVYNLPASDAPAQSRRSLILGVAAVVLVAGLGFLAFRFFTGSASGTGAASPEQAVEQFVTSINERDAVGVVAVFDPDELGGWISSFSPAFDSFEEIDDQGVAENDLTEAYARVFDSFDYSLTGPDGEALTYDVAPLDNNGLISRVRINGLDFSISAPNAEDTALIGAANGGPASALDVSVVDGARVELRDNPRGLVARLLIPGEETQDEAIDDAHLDIVTVQKDGEWYISVGYSMLEIVRNQPEAFPGIAEPQFGRGYELVANQTGGADSPEAAVRRFLLAFETLDYNTMIELIDPLGTPYLHDYQPLIDEQVDDADRRDAAREIGLVLDEIELGTSEWEGRTLVTVGNISGRLNDGSFNFDASTWCGSATSGGDRIDGCLEEAIQELLFEIDNDADPRDFLPEQVGMIVAERNGRWYVDMLGTTGFFSAQISDATALLTGDIGGNAATGFGQLVVVDGPIARQGSPATTTAASGTAGVAIDLAGFQTVGDDFDQMHVALARVTSSSPGTYLSYDNVPLGGVDWFVTYDNTDTSDSEFPAVAATTDGTLGVELFDVQVTQVGVDGFGGQLGGEGRPQIIVLDVPQGYDVNFEGVEATGVAAWDSNGVAMGSDPFGFSSFDGLTGDLFVVIEGEPGATFRVDVLSDSSAEVAEPTQDSGDASDDDGSSGVGELGDVRADTFQRLIEPLGYTYYSEQGGGYFDGCGPSDPDVISYLFETADADRVLVTPYPSVARAEAALAALRTVQSPCDDFDDLVVLDVEVIGDNDVRIAWEFAGDAEPTYEHYRRTGDTIVVAVSNELATLENQLRFLNEF